MIQLAKFRQVLAGGLALAAVATTGCVLSGPSGVSGTESRDVVVGLRPQIQGGRFIQAIVPLLTASDVATVEVTPLLMTATGVYEPILGGTAATTSADDPARLFVAVGSEGLFSGGYIEFRNMKARATYRFQAKALSSSGQEISDPAASVLDLQVGYDDSPTLAPLPVVLKGTPFAATAAVRIVSGTASPDFASIRTEVVRLVGGSPSVSLPGSTESFTPSGGEVLLSSLAPNTTYRVIAEALDDAGAVLRTATVDIEVLDDTSVPSATLDLSPVLPPT
ncbi:MAG: hypothetical protein VKO21_08430 [Candidatus Sericytochromatia bacterium]|nr:hypothetical protein [Candidatus Sericytochromatia bacterium]